MNIGDRVRLLHGREEGVVVRFLKGEMVEIEIEDGFVIPVMKKELTIVASEESQTFIRERQEAQPLAGKAKAEPIGEKGLFFSFIERNPTEYALHLINNTDYSLLYVFAEDSGGQRFGVGGGKLEARSAVKLKNYAVREFESWPKFIIQAIFYRTGYFNMKPPLVKSLTVKAASFTKRKSLSPVIGQDGHIYQIDAEERAFAVDPEKIKESFFKAAEESKGASEAPQAVVDLHIEKLAQDHERLSSSEMLTLQLETFERSLNKAIEAGMDEIVFVHGVGAGVLRQAIHKRLSEYKNIMFYKDAMKERFGYGATLVKIK